MNLCAYIRIIVCVDQTPEASPIPISQLSLAA